MKRNLILVCFAFLLVFITGCDEGKEYYCDNGDTLKGTSCISKNSTPAQVQYYCSLRGYYLNGNRCIKDYGSAGSISYAADERYYCSSGYLSGNVCIIESTYNAYER